MRDEIHLYQSTSEDLDYPNKLITASSRGASPSPSSPTGATDSKREKAFAHWHPVLERTLMVLSKLYRCVEVHVFQSLAQQLLRICTHGLKQAAGSIQKSADSPPECFHGRLFLIKNFLILREQISPFQVEFSSQEKKLDVISPFLQQLPPSLTSSSLPVPGREGAANGGGGGTAGSEGGSSGSSRGWWQYMLSVTPTLKIQERNARKNLETVCVGPP